PPRGRSPRCRVGRRPPARLAARGRTRPRAGRGRRGRFGGGAWRAPGDAFPRRSPGRWRGRAIARHQRERVPLVFSRVPLERAPPKLARVLVFLVPQTFTLTLILPLMACRS